MSQGPEKKYLDVAASSSATVFNFGPTPGSNTVGAPTLQLLNGMALGTTGITRIGRQVTIKSWLFRMAVNAAATGNTGLLRVVVVWDSQANGAALTTTDLFESSNVADVLVSPLNLSNRERFQVVMDKVYNLGGLGAVDGVPPDTIHIEKFKKMNKIVTFNGGNAGTVGDIATNSLYLITFGSVGTASPSTSYHSRIRFTDA